jgi:glycosyltransferase involved in cell wall biosynthesis
MSRHQGAGGLTHAYATCFDGRLSRELKSQGTPVYVLGDVRYSRPWTVWRARRSLRSLVRMQRPDVLISHGPWCAGLLRGSVGQLPLVLWLHDPPHHGTGWVDRLARSCPWDRVLCNSRYTLGFLPGYLPNTSGHVVYCPIDLPESPRAKEADRRVRTILLAARWEEHKGRMVLLDALKRLDDLPDWECVFTGEPQQPHEARHQAAVRQRVRELALEHRIRWLGWVAEIGSEYAKASVLCQPNVRPEPFGLTFVEALGHGTAVVASQLGAAGEIVDDPSLGELVPPGDAAALADALRRRLLERETADLRMARWRKAVSLCDPLERLNELGRILQQPDRSPTR